MSRARGSSFEEKHHRGDEPHLLREVVRTYQVVMTVASRELGMPASRFALMRLLAVAKTGVGVMDLARQMGVNAVYAALFEPEIQKLKLEDLPTSHMQGPDYLGVLRAGDIPQALTLLAP